MLQIGQPKWAIGGGVLCVLLAILISGRGVAARELLQEGPKAEVRHGTQAEKLIQTADVVEKGDPGYYTLGFFAGMRPEQLCPLVSSWRRYEYGLSKLVVFVHTWEVEPFSKAFPGVEFHGVTDFHTEAVKHRFFVYKEYIDARVHLIKGVLLADMRDGVFNRRGFFDSPSAAASVNKNFVVFVLEGNLGKDGQPEHFTMGQSDLNTEWVGNCFGMDLAKDMGKAPVTCAGTTYGSGEAMQLYTNAMVSFLKANMSCNDQGIHIYMLHKLVLKGRTRFKGEAHGQGQSAVYTATFGFPIEVDQYGAAQVRRTNDQTKEELLFVPWFIHQYDRSKDLEKRLHAGLPCFNHTTFW